MTRPEPPELRSPFWQDTGAMHRLMQRPSPERPARPRLSRTLVQWDARFELHNEPGLISPLVSRLERQVALLWGRDPVWRTGVATALHEALANALYHGNL